MEFTKRLLEAIRKLPFVDQSDDDPTTRSVRASLDEVQLPPWPASSTGYRCVWCCARAGNPHEPDCPDVGENKDIPPEPG
jgi:hypothetical protein